MENIYKNDFEEFLTYTDEKKILLSEISREVKRHKTKSLLDIGAGNGQLSIPLSKKVESYLAIEPNKDFAIKLRKAGLEVIEGAFPLKILGTFDMLLASHSIPHRKDLIEPFIKEAWKLVRVGGIFLIITCRGQEDSRTWRMKGFEINHKDPNYASLNYIIQLLALFGKVKTRKITTKIITDTLDTMVQVLSSIASVASSGRRKRKEGFLQIQVQLKKILNQRYRNENSYFFPFQHSFIITEKI